MTIKFDLTVANSLAFLADPSISLAQLSHIDREKTQLALMLDKLSGNVFSLLNQADIPSEKIKALSKRLSLMDETESFQDIYLEIRDYLMKKQWIALIVPSGTDIVCDEILCDPALLGYLLESTAINKGLVLQLEQAPDTIISLLNIHQSLKTALAESINWPGILIWAPGGDSTFLPVNSVDAAEIDIEGRVQWVFSRLFSEMRLDLGRLKTVYRNTFPDVFENEKNTLHIVQMSDLLIGQQASNLRIFRVQQIIRNLLEELGECSKIIPVISGNFMANPSEKQIEKVRLFWAFLSALGTEDPHVVFGNNDVRKDGNINENYRNAIGFQNAKVSWYEQEKLAIISINTVVHGNLPQGAIGVEQLEAIEYEIARKQGSSHYKFIILLHHLPMIHLQLKEALQPFYEKIIAEPFVSAKALENVELLDEFARQHSVAVFLHGHQQIPLIGQTEQHVPVIGCGRSLGRKSNYDGSVYFNINIISINHLSHKMSSRLLAIRKPEGGLVESVRHEIISHTLI